MKFKAQKMKMVGVKFTPILGTENRGSAVKLGDKEQIGTIFRYHFSIYFIRIRKILRQGTILGQPKNSLSQNPTV